MRRALICLLATFTLAVPLTGCGGSDADEPEGEEAESELSEEQREEAEKEAAAEAIPEADRIAYYQIATGSGLLRAWAQAVERGEQPPPRSGDAELRAAEHRLARLEDAENPDLDELADQLLAALRRARGRDPELAAQLVAESDEINKGLQSYVRQTPVVSILLPD
jgi:hypothetical protein